VRTTRADQRFRFGRGRVLQDGDRKAKGTRRPSGSSVVECASCDPTDKTQNTDKVDSQVDWHLPSSRVRVGRIAEVSQHKQHLPTDPVSLDPMKERGLRSW
jgi:hypothetical protein